MVLRTSGEHPSVPVLYRATGGSGADEELVWLLGLADPVHLDDDHAFAADVGQVDEHQRASLDGAQPRRLSCELPPVEEIIDSRTVSSSAT